MAPRPAVGQPGASRDEARAAFARGEAASKRRDWRTAIAEYERAYQLSPHADVLYNIAASYEQLGERRAAAGYYQRYLDDAPGADDRAAVAAKLLALRDHPATIAIEAPAGTAIVIDGRRAGAAPLTVELRRGSHQIVGELATGRAARVIAVEYGEAQTVRLTPSAGRGTLVVTSNAPRATVTIDGREVGTTPWTGVVEAGSHSVIVAAPGFTTVERAVEVPADGTAQIQGALGRPIGYVEPTRRAPSGSHLVIESGSYLPRGYVGAIGAGYRGTSQRFEATTSLTFSAGGGVGWGLRLRGFAATGVVRPYAVAGLNYGSPSSAFVGGGLLLATGQGPVRLEYFVESGYGGGRDTESFTFVPIMAGVNVRMARSQP